MDGVIEEMDDYLEHEKCGEELKVKLEIALEEIFTNISSYAYPTGSGEFCLSCSLEQGDGTLALQFKDWGIPFNPLERREPDVGKSIEERPIGGLGIYMVKKFVDEAHYEYIDGCNVLTLKKKIHS